jgi:hypothetical protein
MIAPRSERPGALALLLLGTLMPVWAADAAEPRLYGASTLALGGASVAIAEGAEAVTSNPAALGLLPGWDVTLPLADGGVRQYNGLLASLSELQELLGRDQRFADLDESEQERAVRILQTLAARPSGASAAAGAGAAVKLRNFGLAVLARSTGGVDLRVDTENLNTGSSDAPDALERNASAVDAASLTTLELRAAYAHSLLPAAVGHQVYAGGALRLVRGTTASYHTALQEIGDPGRSFRPELFGSGGSSGWGVDVDLGLLYAFRTLGRAGLVLQGALAPGFAVEAAEGYAGPRELSLGRQLRFGLGLTPGAGFRIAADVDLNRRSATLWQVEEQDLGFGVEKSFGPGLAVRAGLMDNLAEPTGLSFTGGVRFGAVDLTVAYSPREGLMTADQLAAAVSVRVDRLTYPPGH